MIPISITPADEAIAARRQAFVDAAREAFFTHGYAATPMSAIARTVGGSKTTLWTYFPSKEALFAAVVEDIVGLSGNALSVELPEDRAVREVLLTFARALMETILSPPIVALHRLVLAEATRFPQLAETFFDHGPRRGKDRLAHYLAGAMERGVLRRGDPMIATHQLAGLCQSGSYQDALFNLAGPPDPAALEREIAAAVDSFCRAWAV